jgi:hypothetical protein
MTNCVALLATTVSVSEPPAATLVALALRVTVGAVGVVGAAFPLPHAERINNARSTTHRAKYLQRPGEEACNMTPSCLFVHIADCDL